MKFKFAFSVRVTKEQEFSKRKIMRGECALFYTTIPLLQRLLCARRAGLCAGHKRCLQEVAAQVCCYCRQQPALLRGKSRFSVRLFGTNC